MKCDVLLSSNLPRVIDRSNLSPRHELFIFYFFSYDDQRNKKKNRRQNRFSERRFSEQTSYYRLNWKASLTAVVLLSANNTSLVSVDLIGKKNQVILE